MSVTLENAGWSDLPDAGWSDLPDDAVVDLGDPPGSAYARATVGEIRAAVHAAAMAGREGFACTCIGGALRDQEGA